MSIVNHLLYNKSNERMRQFLEAIRTRDFSLQYSLDNLKGEERSLAKQINEAINEFREMTLRQEAQYQYFGAMLDTVNAFLIVADDAGEVYWMNRAAVDELCGFMVRSVQDLAVVDVGLPSQMQALHPGQQKLVELITKESSDEANKGKRNFVLSVVKFFNKGFSYRLYTLQNVQPVIQKSETDAQQKLVRVLTHEIMNSLTPIISLSETLCDGIQQNTLNNDDVLMALQAINRRSNGLLQFVNNYRKLQHISQPQFADVRIGDLMTDIQHFFSSSIIQYHIENPEQMVRMDRSQMEQVLINLLKNAQEAVEDCNKSTGLLLQDGVALIELSTHLSTGKHGFSIMIKDKGKGILPDVLDRIFVPFFTTKSKGSGIGLSICKQIVTLHGGTITAASQVGHGACFTIQLPIY